MDSIISTTNFIVVRTIYFFSVPTAIEAAAVDYFLVILPTFFYFTSFTLIVVLWAVLVTKKLTASKRSFIDVVKRVAIGISIFTNWISFGSLHDHTLFFT